MKKYFLFFFLIIFLVSPVLSAIPPHPRIWTAEGHRIRTGQTGKVEVSVTSYQPDYNVTVVINCGEDVTPLEKSKSKRLSYGENWDLDFLVRASCEKDNKVTCKVYAQYVDPGTGERYGSAVNKKASVFCDGKYCGDGLCENGWENENATNCPQDCYEISPEDIEIQGEPYRIVNESLRFRLIPNRTCIEKPLKIWWKAPVKSPLLSTERIAEEHGAGSWIKKIGTVSRIPPNSIKEVPIKVCAPENATLNQSFTEQIEFTGNQLVHYKKGKDTRTHLYSLTKVKISYKRPAVCGNGVCESGESPYDPRTGEGCREDCGVVKYCGDGVCQAKETWRTCPKDCFPLKARAPKVPKWWLWTLFFGLLAIGIWLYKGGRR